MTPARSTGAIQRDGPVIPRVRHHRWRPRRRAAEERRAAECQSMPRGRRASRSIASESSGTPRGSRARSARSRSAASRALDIRRCLDRLRRLVGARGAVEIALQTRTILPAPPAWRDRADRPPRPARGARVPARGRRPFARRWPARAATAGCRATRSAPARTRRAPRRSCPRQPRRARAKSIRPQRGNAAPRCVPVRSRAGSALWAASNAPMASPARPSCTSASPFPTSAEAQRRLQRDGLIESGQRLRQIVLGQRHIAEPCDERRVRRRPLQQATQLLVGAADIAALQRVQASR